MNPPSSNLAKANPVAAGPPYYVKGLALGIPAYLIGIHLWTWVFMAPFYLGGHSDFRQLYAAGYIVRTGHAQRLYDYDLQGQVENAVSGTSELVMPFIRPAYQALVFVPFSLLPYRWSYLAFLTINLLLLGTSFVLLRPWMSDLREVFRWLPAATFLGFLPIAAALIQGQDSIVLLTLLTLAFVCLDHGRELTAGVLVGLGLFKFQIVLPIVVLLLFWRHWRFVRGFALSALPLSALSAWLVGLSGARAYFGLLLFMGGSSPKGGYPLVVNRMANLHGLAYGIAGKWLSAFWIILITVIISGVVMLWLAKLAPAKAGSEALLLAITASALLSYYLLIHDLSVLLLPVVVALSRFICAEATGDAWGRRAARASTLMFVAPVCISYIPEHFFLVALPLLVFLLVLVRSTSLRVAQREALAAGV